MTTPKTSVRILKLEAQINALAQAWLHLAATVEIECGAELAGMETAMQRRHWPHDVEIDSEARQVMRWLCRELDAARAVRQARARDAAGGADGEDG